MNLKTIILLAMCLIFNINTVGIINSTDLTDSTENLKEAEGQDVIIAVIDSKINTEHEYLKDSCIEGKSFILNESNETGHGTAVSGAVLKYSRITAKQLWNSKSNITILPIEINVLDIQTDYGYLMGKAIQYAVDQGASVINMSFSSSNPSIYVYEKIRSGIEKGVIFISAAGNSGLNIYSFPAAYDGVISIGSHNNDNGKFSRSIFSNYNDDVDLLMVGEKILLPDDSESTGYSEKTGTSYSSGAFSGTIGELISNYPRLSTKHIMYALYDTAFSLEEEGCGYGILNIQKAKEYLDKLNNKELSPISYSSTQNLIQIKTENLDIPQVSAGRSHIASIVESKVKIAGNKSSNRAGVGNWDNITKVYAGNDNTVAVNLNNIPMATGYNVFNKNIFRGWTNIKSLTLSPNFTAGLTNDGKVYVTEYLKEFGVNNWNNVIQLCSGAHHLSGVLQNGSVVTSGYNIQMDTSSWKDIVYAASSTNNIVGINKYGKAVAVGDNFYGQCDLKNWANLVSVDVGDGFIVGLKSNGTVVAKGRNIYDVCQVEDLKNIIYIDAADTYFVAIDNQNNVFIKGKFFIDNKTK